MKKIQEKLTVFQVILAFSMGISGIACLLAIFQENWVSSILSGGFLLAMGLAYVYVVSSLKDMTRQIEKRREND